MFYRLKFFILSSIFLIIAAALILFFGLKERKISLRNNISFQKITGGLGMGAVISPYYNLIDFDPRIQNVDDSLTLPVPGIYSYGAHRTSTICYFEEIPTNQIKIIKKEAQN